MDLATSSRDHVAYVGPDFNVLLHHPAAKSIPNICNARVVELNEDADRDTIDTLTWNQTVYVNPKTVIDGTFENRCMQLKTRHPNDPGFGQSKTRIRIRLNELIYYYGIYEAIDFVSAFLRELQ